MLYSFTLISSVNSLASSSLFDIVVGFRRTGSRWTESLRASRLLTVFWGVALVGFAGLFVDSGSAVIVLGLTIASYTYGALLGVFALGVFAPNTSENASLVAFVVTVAAMILLVFGVWHGESGWTLVWRPGADEIASQGLTPIAWPWYPLFGSLITLVSGFVASRWLR